MNTTIAPLEPMTPPVRRAPRGLSTLPAVRKRLGRVVADLERPNLDGTDIARCRALVYALSTIATILRDERDDALVERVDRLFELYAESSARRTQ